MINIKKLYNRNFLIAEFLLSIVITLFGILLITSVLTSETIQNWISLNKKDIYPLIATIAGTLLGFIITGVSIILAFSESEKLRLLKKSKQYTTIYEIYFSTIKFLALSTAIPIFGIIVNDKWADYVLYILIWSIIISSLRIWRCVWALENIIKLIHKS